MKHLKLEGKRLHTTIMPRLCMRVHSDGVCVCRVLQLLRSEYKSFYRLLVTFSWIVELLRSRDG